MLKEDTLSINLDIYNHTILNVRNTSDNSGMAKIGFLLYRSIEI